MCGSHCVAGRSGKCSSNLIRFIVTSHHAHVVTTHPTHCVAYRCLLRLAWCRYAPPDPSLNYTGGGSLGNSFRIAGDGSGWGPLTNCMNTIAAIGNYSGPGGWADPDLLIGPQVYVGGQTDQQARAQFTMWSIFPANLIISQNVLQWTPYALETYSNAELIAINQDPLMSPAARIQGGDLSFPCSGEGALATVVAKACDATDPAQQWAYDAATGLMHSVAYASGNGVLDVTECLTADGSPVAVWPADNGSGTCQGKNQQWKWNVSGAGSLTNANSGTVLDIYDFAGPTVDIWAWNGGVNQQFTLTPQGLLQSASSPQYPSMCVAAEPVTTVCTNVWGRKLSGGAYALGFVNNDAVPANITCGPSCFAALNIPPSVTALTVRDLWAHADVTKITAPFSYTATVAGDGFAAAFKLTPA